MLRACCVACLLRCVVAYAWHAVACVAFARGGGEEDGAWLCVEGISPRHIPHKYSCVIKCHTRNSTTSRNNTQQHAATRNNTQQHAATRSNTQQHAATRSNTQQHAATRSYTQLHAATRSYTQLHVTTRNNSQLPHKVCNACSTPTIPQSSNALHNT